MNLLAHHPIVVNHELAYRRERITRQRRSGASPTRIRAAGGVLGVLVGFATADQARAAGRPLRGPIG